MTAQELLRRHATPLTGRTHQLTAMQRLEIAECAHDHGFIETATILDLDAIELRTCMVESGYAQCPSCEEWREHGELQAIEDVDTQIPGLAMCEECRG